MTNVRMLKTASNRISLNLKCQDTELNGTQSDDSEDATDDDRLGNTDWCQCQRCQVMTTLPECVCCEEIMRVQATRDQIEGLACITEHPGFRSVCLDVFVLQTAYQSYKQYHNGNIPESPERYRYTAYRQLVRWCWGFLGGKKSEFIFLHVQCLHYGAHFQPKKIHTLASIIND